MSKYPRVYRNMREVLPLPGGPMTIILICFGSCGLPGQSIVLYNTVTAIINNVVESITCKILNYHIARIFGRGKVWQAICDLPLWLQLSICQTFFGQPLDNLAICQTLIH